MPLQPQVLIEPFERWSLDLVGPITPAYKGKSYILVYSDYVTKWIEAKPFLGLRSKQWQISYMKISLLVLVFQEK